MSQLVELLVKVGQSWATTIAGTHMGFQMESGATLLMDMIGITVIFQYVGQCY